jgi:hypothetical protein
MTKQEASRNPEKLNGTLSKEPNVHYVVHMFEKKLPKLLLELLWLHLSLKISNAIVYYFCSLLELATLALWV